MQVGVEGFVGVELFIDDDARVLQLFALNSASIRRSRPPGPARHAPNHPACQPTRTAVVLSGHPGTTFAHRARACGSGVVANVIAAVPPGSGKLLTPARRSPSVRTMPLIHLTRPTDTRSRETNMNAGKLTMHGAVTLILGLTLVTGGGSALAMNFGDMMNPSKWMGNNKDRDYDDRRWDGPGYGYGGPGYGGPGWGYGGPGYGYGGPGYGVPGYGYGGPGYGGSGYGAPAERAPAPRLPE